MQTMRESWTDERLDEFATRIDQRFDEVDKRFDRLEGRMNSLQREMNERFEGVHRTMVQGVIGICGVTVTGFVGMISFIALQI